jgi:hypothetical protein
VALGGKGVFIAPIEVEVEANRTREVDVDVVPAARLDIEFKRPLTEQTSWAPAPSNIGA